MPDMLRAALAYAKHGWHVFPCHTPDLTRPRVQKPDGTWTGGCDCKHDDCESAGKHPRTEHGLKDATTDTAIIQRWWRWWANANLALSTGPSRLVLIDIDPRHDGDASLHELELQHGELPETLTVRTGSGGTHLYFRGDASSANGIAPGVDRKARGGYVMLPPSLHTEGRYRWERRVPIADAPEWITTLGGRSNGAAREIGDVIGDGTRNTTLASLAGSMRRRGMSERVIAAALHAVNTECCQPPLSADDVDAIAHSIATLYEPASPEPGIHHVRKQGRFWRGRT